MLLYPQKERNRETQKEKTKTRDPGEGAVWKGTRIETKQDVRAAAMTETPDSYRAMPQLQADRCLYTMEKERSKRYSWKKYALLSFMY